MIFDICGVVIAVTPYAVNSKRRIYHQNDTHLLISMMNHTRGFGNRFTDVLERKC
jgi:hypothetical protein